LSQVQVTIRTRHQIFSGEKGGLCLPRKRRLTGI
jgi:hypothetical protein